MQVSLSAAMNGTRPTFGKQLSLSPKSSDLAQTLNYHITATGDTSEDREFNLGDEAVTYTTQYYTTVEPQSTASSPLLQPSSPGRDSGTLTPTSVSSKESSSSEVASDGPPSLGGTVMQPNNMCVTTSGGMPCTDGFLGVAGSSGSNGNAISGTTVKSWTYEDQFKQLYNLSPEPERKEFLDKLFDFMQKKGSPITRIPIMAKQPLDLYRLFKLVVERGGLVEVIKKKAWRNVAKELNLPASITSAAFTMRSQYVKYLYPYECETVKLSDPQELQMAIDSNKRDRRHSDTIPLLSGENQNIITTQGPLVNSPTVPHASGSPYSSSIIVATPTGQLVQLPQVPGVPIMMPSPHQPRSDSSRTVSEDGEDDISSPREPPTKKVALEANQVKVAFSSDNRLPYQVHTTCGNFIMTPGGTPIVAHPSGMAAAPPQIIHMAPHHPGHIPIVIPTPTASSSAPSPLETNVSASRSIRGGETEAIVSRAVAHELQRRTISVVNAPVPVAAIPPQTSTAGINSTLSPQHHGLLTMPGPAHLMMPAPASPEKKKVENEVLISESNKKAATASDPPISTLKMPFANISIQSAGGQTESGGEGNGSADASLLVTLQLNSVVYQGVLFAKPNSVALSNSSASSTSTR